MFQPHINSENMRPLALLVELLTVIPEEFSTLLLPSQRRAQVTTYSYTRGVLNLTFLHNIEHR